MNDEEKSKEQLIQELRDLRQEAQLLRENGAHLGDDRTHSSQEQRYRAILEDQTELICRYLPDGRLSYVNQAYARYYQKDPEELISSNFIPVIPPRDLENIRNHIGTLTREHPVTGFEHRIIMADGEVRWHHWTHRGIYNAAGEITEYQAVGRDITNRKRAEEELNNYRGHLEELITERTAKLRAINTKLEEEIKVRRKAEQALKKSEEHFRSFVENATDIIYSLSFDGVLTYVSPNWTDLLGHDRAEVIGQRYTSLMHVDDVAGCLEYWNNTINSEDKNRYVEYRVMHKNGQWRWFSTSGSLARDDDGRIYSFMGIARDVTDRKMVQEALRGSEKRFRYIMEHNPHAIAVFDREMKYILVSKKYLQDNDISEENVIGRGFYDVFPKMPEKWRNIHKHVLEGSVEKSDEDIYINQIGLMEYYRWECRPWWDLNGDIGGMIKYSEIITKRKRNEMALKESEERFRTIFQGAAIGMALVSMEGRTLEINSAFADMLGHDLEDLRSISINEITYPEDIEKDGELFERLIDGHIDYYKVEKRFIRRDEEVIWGRVTMTLMPHTKDEPEFALVMVEDINERKIAVEALQASEGRFRTMVDFTYDWETWRAPDGSYIYVSPSCERVTGYTRDEFIHDPWLSTKIVVPDDRDALVAHFQEEFESGEALNFDFRVVTKEGRERWISHICQPVFDENNVRLGRRCSNRDITARKRAEQELTASNERYRALIQGLPVGVMSVDQDDKITEWNTAASAITGFSENEVLGKLCQEVLGCSGWEGPCQVRGVVRQGMPTGPEEKDMRCRDGSIVPVRINAAPLYDENGQVTGGVETFQDISDARALEKVRESIYSMLVHDMKSPLVSIQGFVHRLQEKSENLSEERKKGYLGIIKKETAKLESLVLDFLEFSRLREEGIKLNPEMTDINAIVLDMEETYQPRFKQNGVELGVQLSNDLFPVMADGPRLRRVFTNLLENALKHSPEHTSVTIRTSLNRDNHCVYIEISDQGPGIPSEDIQRIFEPFYRGDTGEAYRGHGLGLAGVQTIVQGHGGHVEVTNRPGGGSVFSVILPVEAKTE